MRIPNYCLVKPAAGKLENDPKHSCRGNGRALFIVLLLTAFSTISTQTAQGASWRGIVPLRSSKKSVLTKLGKPIFQSEDRLEFEHRDGKLVIFFYTRDDATQLNLSPVVAERVLTIYLYPKRPKEFDRRQLARTIRSVGRGVTADGEVMTSYDDGERGISYHFIEENTRVWRIVYYAPRVEFEKVKLKTKSGHPATEHP